MTNIPKWQFGNPTYGTTRRLPNVTLAQARPAVEEALRSQGFGVLTVVDVQATMKQKLDADVPPYVILGACNPPLAHAALSAEPGAGLLMPCNVVLVEEEDGVAVSAVDTVSLFKLVGRPDVEPLAHQVNEKLTAALEAIKL